MAVRKAAKGRGRTSREDGIKRYALAHYTIFKDNWAVAGVTVFVIGMLILMVRDNDPWSLVFVVLGALVMWLKGYTLALVKFRK